MNNGFLNTKTHNDFFQRIINSYLNCEFKTKQQLAKNYKISLATLNRYEKLYDFKLTKKPPNNFTTFKKLFTEEDIPQKIKKVISEALEAKQTTIIIDPTTKEEKILEKPDHNIRLRASQIAIASIEPIPIQKIENMQINQNKIMIVQDITDNKKIIDTKNTDDEGKHIEATINTDDKI